MASDLDLMKLRHSAAHLLAQALLIHFPKTILTIGPATEDGFFYDFLPETSIKEADLAIIEATMRKLADENLTIHHEQISKSKAYELFKNNPFKIELINGIPEDTAGLATQGNFIDLCKGGHVHATGQLKHVKLLAISGSYWRGNRDGQALQRISGVVFATAQELETYLTQREEALKYDHRRLGKQLDLFSFHDEGAGFPFFHHKGKLIINTMISYIRAKLYNAGYQEIATPIMLCEDLWKQSGHYEHYKKNMFFCHMDHQSYAVRPMNCPGAILVYRERPRSYRELPLRLAEFGHVHRYELSGVLHGLFRVRAFTQDDGHIFCMVNQIKQEVQTTIMMTHEVLKKFGFDNVQVALSTRPENSLGSDEFWNQATDALKEALDDANVSYKLQEGEGAFYGPKIEFHISDSMGRTWQCSTIQLDFFLPQNFDLSYVASSGEKERPVMIHRAIYGSLERFLGILLEHHKGHIPFFLAPTQIRVLTITDDQKEYAHSIAQTLQSHGLRAECDESSDPLAGKIKSAQLDKIPWMLVVGKKEVENNTVTLRHNDGKQEFGLNLDTLISKARDLR